MREETFMDIRPKRFTPVWRSKVTLQTFHAPKGSFLWQFANSQRP